MNSYRVLGVLAGVWAVSMATLLVLPHVAVGATAVLVLCAIGFGAALRAARISGSGTMARRAWRAFAAVFPLELVTLALFLVPGSDRQFPAPADLARLAIVGVLLLAAYSFPMRAVSALERRKSVLDVLLAGAAAAMAVWYLVVGPYVGERPGVVAAAAAFPVLDVLLVLGFTRLLRRGTIAAGSVTVTALAAAVLFMFCFDAWTGYLASHGGDTARDDRYQVMCVLTWLTLLAAAPVLRCGEPEDASALAERCVFRPAVPYIAITVGFGLMIYAATREQSAFPWSGLTLGGLAITGLVVLRQLAVQRESDQAAATDGLTGLANRSHLRDRLIQGLERDSRGGRATAVLLVDMNGFKQVNDTQGHKAGDQLLIGVARVLREAILGADVAGRLGGDEFAVVLHDIGSEANAEAVARRIVAATGEPVMIDGRPVRPSVSIGIALSGPGEFTADELLHRADVAMYHAKRRRGDGGGESRWACFADTMGSGDGPSLEDELRAATAVGQLRLVFQPIVGLPDEELAGVEALARWEHPRLGLLEADAFIPLAERIGVIDDIGRWVLREACSYARRWPQIPLHVNVSARQLEEDGFSAEVRAIVRATGMNAAHLVLEVTESQLIVDEVPRAHLQILADEGIRIALDDFGTGYSSLSNLTTLPIDMLKLDRVFVATLDNSAEGAAVAQAVLRLGRVLGMDLVAEGVETAAQARELTLLGATKAQGHYFARPLPASEIDGRIAAWSDNRYGRSLRA
ncbi:putative bifunctional diguanylate cyclase/phosphodiesterase [Symbioplanes lichenis]|uniref:putative bifunctional diguanylate cyclase/phosphodiesterase n=1 Tax=Symbioplanes lichenis TaxID=1629072 RepID=UPI00273878E2|nr:EAL domain-containing protein [Actinoplanes lichenis]